MKSVLALILISFSFLTISCGLDLLGSKDENTKITLSRDLSESEIQISNSLNEFGLTVFKSINLEKQDENTVFSPLSLSYILGMIMTGADGETKDEIQETLNLSNLDEEEIFLGFSSLNDLLLNLDPKVDVQNANSIWYREDLNPKPGFIENNIDYFGSELFEVDFMLPETIDRINGWVSDKTNGMITEMPPEEPYGNIVAYLLNAIYFKGDWLFKFDIEKTRDAQFHGLGDLESTVKMMSQGNGEFQVHYGENFSAVYLPYGGEAFSMSVILPNYGIDINEFISNLSYTDLDFLKEEIVGTVENLSIPKFEVESKMKLPEILKRAGITSAFSAAANFQQMTDLSVFLSDVVQKAVIKVNEDGTSAAAVTSATIRELSISAFVADRPFVYVIYEQNSDTILFMGKVVKPEYEEN